MNSQISLRTKHQMELTRLFVALFFSLIHSYVHFALINSPQQKKQNNDKRYTSVKKFDFKWLKSTFLFSSFDNKKKKKLFQFSRRITLDRELKIKLSTLAKKAFLNNFFFSFLSKGKREKSHKRSIKEEVN